MRNLFDALDLLVSVLANSAMYDDAPDLMAAFHPPGDEVVGHGRTHSERQSTMDRVGAATLFAEATEILRQAEGTAPQCWLCPWIAESRDTPDLLVEAGYGII